MKSSRQIFILILLFISSKCLSNAGTLDLNTQLSNFLSTKQVEIAEKGYRSDYDIGNIDPRFNAKGCTTPLEFSLNRSPLTQSNLTVLAECRDETPWKIYITTKFYVYGNVVYASNTLPR